MSEQEVGNKKNAANVIQKLFMDWRSMIPISMIYPLIQTLKRNHEGVPPEDDVIFAYLLGYFFAIWILGLPFWIFIWWWNQPAKKKED